MLTLTFQCLTLLEVNFPAGCCSLTLTFRLLMLPRVTFYCKMLHANSDLSMHDVAEGNILMPEIAC